MRKILVVAAIAALVTVPAALAKERNVALTGLPSVTEAGRVLTARINITMDRQPSGGNAPTVRLINNSISTAGRVINITARPTGRLGSYRARVVFPTAGTWRVVVVDTETSRAYSFGRVRVVRAA